MAEIDVVPKRHSNVWLWVLLAIVALVVVLAASGVFHRNNAGNAPNRSGQLMPRAPVSLVAITSVNV